MRIRNSETLADALAAVGRAPLNAIPPALAARVARRVRDHERVGPPPLDVAAFSSAT